MKLTDSAAPLGARLVECAVRAAAADLVLRLCLPRPARLCVSPLCRVGRGRDYRVSRHFVLSHQGCAAAAAAVRQTE